MAATFDAALDMLKAAAGGARRCLQWSDALAGLGAARTILEPLCLVEQTADQRAGNRHHQGAANRTNQQGASATRPLLFRQIAEGAPEQESTERPDCAPYDGPLLSVSRPDESPGGIPWLPRASHPSPEIGRGGEQRRRRGSQESSLGCVGSGRHSETPQLPPTWNTYVPPRLTERRDPIGTSAGPPLAAAFAG